MRQSQKDHSETQETLGTIHRAKTNKAKIRAQKI